MSFISAPLASAATELCQFPKRAAEKLLFQEESGGRDRDRADDLPLA